MFTLKKKSDNRKDPDIPLFIPVGTVRQQSEFVMPEVGKRFLFGTLMTTEVISIPIQEEGHIEFNTMNSTYVLSYE
jgi:hypothetical protein